LTPNFVSDIAASSMRLIDDVLWFAVAVGFLTMILLAANVFL
jgi:hypothetical protein